MWKKAVTVHANKARARRKKEDVWRSMVMTERGWAVCGRVWRDEEKRVNEAHDINTRASMGQGA